MTKPMTDEEMVELERHLSPSSVSEQDIAALIARVREEQAKAAAAREEQREADARAVISPFTHPHGEPCTACDEDARTAAAIRATPLTETPLADRLREAREVADTHGRALATSLEQTAAERGRADRAVDKSVALARVLVGCRETLLHAQQNVRALTGGDERRVAATLRAIANVLAAHEESKR